MASSSSRQVTAQKKPRNHNLAVIALSILLALLLLGAIIFRGVIGESVSASYDPLAPIPASVQ